MPPIVEHAIRVFDPDVEGFDFYLVPDRAGNLTVTHGGKYAGLTREIGGGFFPTDVPTVFGVSNGGRKRLEPTPRSLEDAVAAISAHWAQVDNGFDQSVGQ